MNRREWTIFRRHSATQSTRDATEVTCARDAKAEVFIYRARAFEISRKRMTFRMAYDAGDLPARASHAGANAVAWRHDPKTLNPSVWLPVFIDGVKEKRHPHRMLAVCGARELIESCEEKDVLEALPRVIFPIKAALRSRDFVTVAVAFNLLHTLVTTHANMAKALVPYYRQILPAFNEHKDANDVFVCLANLADAKCWNERLALAAPLQSTNPSNSRSNSLQSPSFAHSEAIGYGRSKRSIASIVRRTLDAFEREGGDVDAIRAVVPAFARRASERLAR